MSLNPDLQNWDGGAPSQSVPRPPPHPNDRLMEPVGGRGWAVGRDLRLQDGQAEGGALGGVSVRGSWARRRDPWASSCLSPMALTSVVPTHLAMSC